MTEIRPATAADIPMLVEMGERFFRYSAFSRFTDYAPAHVEQMLGVLLDSGIVLVAEGDERLAGAVVGTLSPLWFNHAVTVATEVAWWVEPDHRGTTGLRLLKAFETAARDRGAHLVSVSDLVIDGRSSTGDMLGRLDYELVERSHVRRA